MRGGELGSRFSGAVRAIVPVVKKVVLKLAKKAFTFVKGVVEDVLSGKKVGASLKCRAKETGVGLLSDMEKRCFSFQPSS